MSPLPITPANPSSHGLRWLLTAVLTTVLAMASLGCSEKPDPDEAIPDIAFDEEATPSTLVPVGTLPPDEQEAYDAMMEAALVDGFTMAEMELFAHEAVACARRAGIDAEVVEFDRVTGNATFRASDPKGWEPTNESEDPLSNTAWDWCIQGYYDAAQLVFEDVGEFDSAAADAEVERRKTAVINCVRDAGYEAADIREALFNPDIPENVHRTCSRLLDG